MRRRAKTSLLALPVATAVSWGAMLAAQTAEVSVTFLVNDAFVKDKMLPGVTIAVFPEEGAEALVQGQTDAEGRLVTSLAPGSYLASFALPQYVPLRTAVEVREDAQTITTTLSMRLEAEGLVAPERSAERRVRAILNWGSDPSQVRDADSHLAFSCGAEAKHVYFGDMAKECEGFTADLDVDDTTWGGPETITLRDPTPGTYLYWVHNYSNSGTHLGAADIVVRVLFDDRLAGEYRIPRDVDQREWRPFKEMLVAPGLEAEIVAFSDQELAAGADRVAPEGYRTDAAAGEAMSGCAAVIAGLIGSTVLLVPIVLGGGVVLLLVARRFRR